MRSPSRPPWWRRSLHPAWLLLLPTWGLAMAFSPRDLVQVVLFGGLAICVAACIFHDPID